MKIIDISWPITGDITAYKDKKVVAVNNVKNFEEHNVRESAITLGSHTGTHVDAPTHFLKQGATIDQIKLERLIGRCKVLDFTDVNECITADDLIKKNKEMEIEKYDIVLFKTQNSSISPTKKFTKDFIYLDKSGAEYLAQKHVKAVGTDYLGIERNQPDHETHVILMQHEIVIIEGLRLEHVDQGTYTLYCLPLYSTGLEAAPARAILTD